MKKYLTLLLGLVLSTCVAFAGNPKKKTVETQTFKTDIVCQSCEKKIMNNVSVLGKGVKDVKVDLATKEVTITYDANKTTPEKLVKGFSKLDIKAEPKAAGEGCGAAQSGCSGANKGCGAASKGCGSAQSGCGAASKGCGGNGGCSAGMKTGCDEKATTDARPACRAKEAGANSVPEKAACQKADGAAKKACCKQGQAAGSQEKKSCCKEKKEGSCQAQKASCCQEKAASEKAKASCCKEKAAGAKEEGSCCKEKKAEKKAEGSCCKAEKK